MNELPEAQAIAGVLAYLDQRADALTERLRTLVDINTGIDNPAGRLRALGKLERFWTGLGFETEHVKRPGELQHLICRRPSPKGPAAPKVLLLGHIDTVFDASTTFLSFTREGPWARGPGVGDMKGGIVVAQAALEALAHIGRLNDFDWVVVHNADEEVQSPTSRDLIEAAAADRDLCLDFEVGRESGAIVRSRAGVGRYFITVNGRAAHAGMHHREGANAIVALADIVQRVSALTDYRGQTTVNVGVFRGGSKRNVVAEQARCEVDVRIRDEAEGERIDAAIRAICAKTSVPGTKAEVVGGIGRPPWRRFAGSDRLVQHFIDVAADLGVNLHAEDTGGGSDASLVAALGVPTVDGLGPVGAGVHTEQERIQLYTLVERAKLVAAALLLYKRPAPIEA